ncbi:DUF927 domain-containing protein [Burkholderia cenocepacia]|uniref:DUF927 domain-containing protein n=1 Tax=Burkholderia cenocepacia TaxID=95486 RepID=UPI00158C8E80|nr:DUF927 domain-containing protein [Burkholderia cenocepacia]
MLTSSKTSTLASHVEAPSAPSLSHADGGQQRIDFEQLAELALANFSIVVEDILGLQGEYHGREFVAFNPKRDDYELGSFKINVDTGKYADFAIQDECSGGDLIALASYIWNLRPIESAKRLRERLKAEVDVPTALDLIRYANHQRGDGSDFPIAMKVMKPIPEGSPELDVRGFEFHGSRVERRYDYMDINGKLCFVQLRLRTADGDKTFMTLRVDKREDGTLFWTGGMPEGQRPLWGLKALIEASNDQQVYVVEGEKAALALQKMMPSVVAVTSAGGASAPLKTDWSPLAGRDIVIWRDNDEPGLKYQERVIRLIRAVDPNSKISTIDVESLMRTLCIAMNWVYDEKVGELKGWDAADVAELAMDSSVVFGAVASACQEVPVDGSEARGEVLTDPEKPRVSWASGTIYRVKDGFVLASKTGKDGEPIMSRVCSRVDIVRQLRDSESTGWSLDLILHTPDGQSTPHILPRSRLSDQRTLRAEMNDLGVVVYNWVDFQQYLEHAIPRDTHRLVRSVGWSDGAFVQQQKVYGTESELIALDSDAPACDALRQQGELATWNSEIGHLCSENSRLMLSVCAALAGPLLHLVGMESGGIHFVGASSVGKTTALRVAASIWGRPDQIIKSWRSTSNGLEIVAAGLNDCVLLLDEMNQASPSEVGDTIYMLGNGQGKTRMTRSGDRSRFLQWRLMFMSTGEIPLQQHVESAGQRTRAGMEVRLLNIPADVGQGFGLFDTIGDFDSSRALADHLLVASSRVFGVVGDAWLEHLTRELAERGHDVFCSKLKERLQKIEARLFRLNADGQVGRATRRFGLLALAGAIASEAGIVFWTADQSITMVERCLESWIAERGGTGAAEEMQALRQVQQFFEQHGQAAFQRINRGIDDELDQVRTVVNRAGYVAVGEGIFYVLPEAFRSRICDGLDYKFVVKVLSKHGMLLGDTSNTVRVPGVGSIRAWRISTRIVGYSPELTESDEGPQVT